MAGGMNVTSLPSAAAFEELAGMLLGRKVKARIVAAMPNTQIRAAATYVGDAGALAFVVTTDMPCVASVGAALALIPPAQVAEAVKTGKPSELLVENAYEVFNVAASLFNTLKDATQNPTHVKIDGLAIGPLDPKLAARLVKPAARVDFEFNITGYPDGKMTVFAVVEA